MYRVCVYVLMDEQQQYVYVSSISSFCVCTFCVRIFLDNLIL